MLSIQAKLLVKNETYLCLGKSTNTKIKNRKQNTHKNKKNKKQNKKQKKKKKPKRKQKTKTAKMWNAFYPG